MSDYQVFTLIFNAACVVAAAGLFAPSIAKALMLSSAEGSPRASSLGRTRIGVSRVFLQNLGWAWPLVWLALMAGVTHVGHEAWPPSQHRAEIVGEVNLPDFLVPWAAGLMLAGGMAAVALWMAAACVLFADDADSVASLAAMSILVGVAAWLIAQIAGVLWMGGNSHFIQVASSYASQQTAWNGNFYKCGTGLSYHHYQRETIDALMAAQFLLSSAALGGALWWKRVR